MQVRVFTKFQLFLFIMALVFFATLATDFYGFLSSWRSERLAFEARQQDRIYARYEHQCALKYPKLKARYEQCLREIPEM